MGISPGVPNVEDSPPPKSLQSSPKGLHSQMLQMASAPSQALQPLSPKACTLQRTSQALQALLSPRGAPLKDPIVTA